MHDVDELRKIALGLLYLKTALKESPSRKKVPDHELAKLLNDVQPDLSKFTFEGPYINKLLNIQILDLNASSRKQILDALQSLIKNRRLDVDITGPTPKSIENEFASELPPCFREPLPSSQLEGAHLGQDANILNGIWQLFFCRPPNEPPNSPLIRGKVAIIRDAYPGGTSAKVDVISEHSHWKGHCFVNDSHLYIVATHVDRIDSHFYIMNRPRVTDIFLFGIGSTIHRPSEHPGTQHIRPAEAYCLFGTKWTDSPTMASDVKGLCSRILAGESIPPSSELEAKLRKSFCAPTVRFAGMKEFKQNYPKLEHSPLMMKHILRERGS
jgi:hypothetical protein